MLKRTTLFILQILQLGLILLYFAYQKQQPLLYAQTIPTVTPPGSEATATPMPEPTATEESGSTNPPPPANTNTPVPSLTPSPTSELAPTPEDGFLPTTAPCTDSPTIQALNTLNVRQGPGLEYQIIDQLVFLEVRPIIGRSQYDQWWLIELASGESGWVADALDLAQGFIGNVPIVPPPAVNGQTPTPGVPWQPTPDPSCTVTPTNTVTITPSPTATPTPTPTPTVSATSTPTIASTSAASNEGDAATRIALSAVTIEPTPSLPTAYPPRPTATPLDVVSPASTPNFLPVVGLVLIAGGIFAAIVRRRFSNQ